MLWRYGIFGAAVSGMVWAFIWQTLLTVLLILVLGSAQTLHVGPALFAGLFSAVGYSLIPPARRHRAQLIVSTALFVGLVCIFSVGLPFAPATDFGWLSALIATVTLGALVAVCAARSIGDMPWRQNSRFVYEAFYIRLLWGVGLVFFILIVAIPFYVMLMTSLKNQPSLLANPLDLSIDLAQPPQELFRSYIELFTQYHFLTFLLNSTIVSLATVLITLLFSVPGAYAVARLRFNGQAFLSRSILLIYLIPAIILVIPLYAVFSQVGLRNSLLGLCIVYPATTIPVALYMLQGYFAGLPRELDDAGLMDGLSRLQVIVKITMPLSLPALASVGLYVFMIAWNEFLFSFMFLDDINLFTLSRGIVSLNSSEVPRQHLMAGSVIATVPVLILFLSFERFLVSGLTAGSVKG